MSLSGEQADAIMDLVDQCRAVNYAWLQTGYHADHVRSSGHVHNCGQNLKSKAACKQIGDTTKKHFQVKFDELQLAWDWCKVVNVPTVDSDTIMYHGLPAVVLADLYRIEREEQVESA